MVKVREVERERQRECVCKRMVCVNASSCET